jgi:hypothetical protein
VRVVWLSVLLASVALAEEDDDGPPVPPPTPATTEARAATLRPSRQPTFTSTRLRAEPHWPLALFELSGLITGLQNAFFGVDLVAGVPLGVPVRPNRRLKQASGWLVMPIVEASLGRVNGPICMGVRLCGERFLVGPGLKFGHGVGVLNDDGLVRPGRMLYVQVTALGGNFDVQDAPLAPGDAWFEGVVRARLGGHLGSVDFSGEGTFLSTFSLNVAAIVEYVALSPFTRGFGFGGAVGVAF